MMETYAGKIFVYSIYGLFYGLFMKLSQFNFEANFAQGPQE